MRLHDKVAVIAIATVLALSPGASAGGAERAGGGDQTTLARQRSHQRALDEYLTMLGSEEVDQRLRAVEGLSALLPELLDPSSALDLLAAAERDPSAVVARQAITIIEMDRARREGRAFEDAGGGDPRSAASALRHRAALERDLLAEHRQGLASPAFERRLQAVRALSAVLIELADPAAARALLENAESDTDRTVAQAASEALIWERERIRGSAESSPERSAAVRAHRARLERERVAELASMLEGGDVTRRMIAVKSLSAMLPDMIQPAAALSLVEAAAADDSDRVADHARRVLADRVPDQGSDG